MRWRRVMAATDSKKLLLTGLRNEYNAENN